MLTLLKVDLAVRQSRALVRTFKQMKGYIIENQGLIFDLSNPQLKYRFLLLKQRETTSVVRL